MEKQCGNCINFLEYYVKLNHQFMSVCAGRCKLKRVNSNEISSFGTACDKWQDNNIKIQERKRTVREAIIDISEKLDKIAAILTDEE